MSNRRSHSYLKPFGEDEEPDDPWVQENLYSGRPATPNDRKPIDEERAFAALGFQIVDPSVGQRRKPQKK